MRLILLSLACYLTATALQAQGRNDSVLQDASLNNCVNYAIRHQPLVQQALLDENIVEKQIQIKLADWYPQLGATFNLQHNFQLPTSYFAGAYVQNGTYNTSALGLGVTQNIFNRDVLLATRTANEVRRQSRQTTTSSKIDVAVSVSKAFFDVLLTQKQVDVLGQAVIRLDKSEKDAYNQYKGGIVDKTDYKRATITLNNAKTQLKQSVDLVTAKYAYLKQLMGYPDSAALVLQYDSARIEKDALIDTVQSINYDNRIEYQLLQTQQRLQQSNLKYYQWGYLPTVSAFGNYNLGYLNNDFAKTYNQTFPSSNIGVQVAVPIFQGNKRVQQIRQAELQIRRVDLDMVLLKSKVNAQYQQSIAIYKGNLFNYYALKDNVLLADDVYNTIRLQYTSGIKTYLEVIIAESDLRTAQLNFYNALYQLMQSKFDVQKALGTVQY